VELVGVGSRARDRPVEEVAGEGVRAGVGAVVARESDDHASGRICSSEVQTKPPDRDPERVVRLGVRNGGLEGFAFRIHLNPSAGGAACSPGRKMMG